MLPLRQNQRAGEEAHRRPPRRGLLRLHRPLQRDPDERAGPPAGGGRGPREHDSRRPPDLPHRRKARLRRRRPEAARDRGVHEPVHRGPGAGQARRLGRRLQPLQACPGSRDRRRRDPEEQRPDRRPHRPRARRSSAQTLARMLKRPPRHRRRDRPHRGGLRGRGRREHPPQALAGGRAHRPSQPQGGRRARHHLRRRDRQDRSQGGEHEHHPRRERRGRPAGPPEDPGGHRRQHPPAGRPQAPEPGVHPDRHEGHPVHRGRRVRGHRGPHPPPYEGERHGLQGRPERRPAEGPECPRPSPARRHPEVRHHPRDDRPTPPSSRPSCR